jgi:D-beta-D-heptose 7-phosphate kinase/D-beta-D-heptose 1-phosphate adenosyltransferase
MSKDRHLIPLVERLDAAIVGCVGDLMLDHFIYGDVSRISPEAPIPVLRIRSQQSMLGGLGNVVRNLGALGCGIRVFSVTGDDAAGGEVSGLLDVVPRCQTHLLPERERKTPVKVRYIAHGQQLLRADNETTQAISNESLQGILAKFREAISECTIVVLSDYAKGMLTGDLAGEFIREARALGKPVIVDPKGGDFSRYRHATLIKPNLKELGEATGLPVNDTSTQETAARKLLQQTESEYILVTRGSEGMLVVPRDGAPFMFPALAREVFEVSGAGDTVASALAAALGSGAKIEEAVAIANIAAGIVVGKMGTAVVDRSEIVNEIEQQSALSASDKVLRAEEAGERARMWKRMGLRIGFVFGLFDRISQADLMLLEKARTHCDRLVVGLESDSPRSTGAQDQAVRAYILASLVFSDAVVICDSPHVDNLLAAIIPDVVLTLNGTPGAWTQAWSGELIELQEAAKLHAGQAGD